MSVDKKITVVHARLEDIGHSYFVVSSPYGEVKRYETLGKAQDHAEWLKKVYSSIGAVELYEVKIDKDGPHYTEIE